MTTVSTETPKPPTWLSQRARVIWEQKLNELASRGPLEHVDFHALELFCVVVVKYAELAEKEILTIPEHRLLQRYSWRILLYADRLGFNPPARLSMARKRRSG